MITLAKLIQTHDVNPEMREILATRWRRRAARWNSNLWDRAGIAMRRKHFRKGIFEFWELVRARKYRKAEPVILVDVELRRHACCSKARRVFCVCRIRTECPDHGTRCNGSHD